MKGLKYITVLLIIIVFHPYSKAQLLLNEINVNPPGTDNPYEFIELKGNPGSVINNTYLCVFEGDSASAGNADMVIKLSNITLGSNGLYFIGSSAGYSNILPPTIFRDTIAFSAATALENGSTSFMLIFSVTPIVLNTDYDVDNNGILELPTGASVLDAVGWISYGATGAIIYGGVAITENMGTPDAAVRFNNNTTANSSGAWYCGDFLSSSSGSSPVFDQTKASANFPVGGALSPGGFNLPGINGINDNKANSIAYNCYPNPANESVVLSNIQSKDVISIYNMLGKEVYHSMSVGDIESINSSNFTNGVYFVTVKRNESSMNNRLIIAH